LPGPAPEVKAEFAPQLSLPAKDIERESSVPGAVVDETDVDFNEAIYSFSPHSSYNSNSRSIEDWSSK
jgi:hypothetical protein